MHHHVPGSLACRWGRSRDSLASITTCTNFCSKALHIPVCFLLVLFLQGTWIKTMTWEHEKKWQSLAGWLSWLEDCPRHQKRCEFDSIQAHTYIVDSCPSQGTQGRQTIDVFFLSHPLPFSLSLSLSLPLLLPFLSCLRSRDMPLGKD